MSNPLKLVKKVSHGIYWRAKMVPPLYQITMAMGNMRRDALLGKAYPEVYEKFASKPVNPKKIIFVENNSLKVSDNFEEILEDLRKDGSYTVHVHFLEELTSDRGGFNYNCARLAADAATAAYIFLNDYSNVISCLPMRKETKVIQLWHACGAFKKFGKSTLSLKFGQTKRQQEKHPIYGYGNLDYVTVSSEEIAWAYTEAMQLEDKKTQVVASGISRTDRFFDPDFREKSCRRVRGRYPESAGKKIILYAPTWRDNQHTSGEGYTYKTEVDFDRLREELGEEYVILFRAHYLVANSFDFDRYEGFVRDVSSYSDINDLYIAADILITDYSSVFFDYANLRKPEIFYMYDLEEYAGELRGFYISLDELPGPIVRDEEALIREIRACDEWQPDEKYEEFCAKYNPNDDGHASERVLARIIRR